MSVALVRKGVETLKRLLFEPEYLVVMGVLCLIAETLINTVIIEKVRYTEIDWAAYMSEVEGFLNGTTDYTKLKGGTGPLVYPAGFVYVFAGLYHVTGRGRNIRLAQYLFGVLYLVCYSLVVVILRKAQAVPPFILLFFTFASYRVHSLFALRLFNDPVAMVILYLAVYFFLQKEWFKGCITFSLAVSIKMNIMLFAPGLFFILLVEQGLARTVGYITACGVVQLALGMPFLLDNPMGYLKMSFDLGRQFFFKWTVNFRFLPEHVFLSRYLHVGLLLVHVWLLVGLYLLRWRTLPRPLTPHSLLIVLLSSNFVGVACARSLHYQFYVWYYHSLPPLLFSTSLPQPVVMLLLGVIELCWNTYPSTVISSFALQLCHVVGAVALLLPPRRRDVAKIKSR